MWPRFITISCFLIIAIFLGYFNFKKLSTPFKWLTICLTFVFASDILAMYLAYQGGSHPALHLLVPILVFFYSVIFSSFRKNKIAFLIFSPLLILFSILNLYFFQTIHQFPTYPLMLLSIGVTLTSLFDFKRILESPTSINILRLPVFWFDIGSLVFYSITFFIFSLTNLFLSMRPAAVMWFVVGANLFMYSCFSLGVFFDSRNKTTL